MHVIIADGHNCQVVVHDSWTELKGVFPRCQLIADACNDLFHAEFLMRDANVCGQMRNPVMEGEILWFGTLYTLPDVFYILQSLFTCCKMRKLASLENMTMKNEAEVNLCMIRWLRVRVRVPYKCLHLYHEKESLFLT